MINCNKTIPHQNYFISIYQDIKYKKRKEKKILIDFRRKKSISASTHSSDKINHFHFFILCLIKPHICF